MHTQQDPGIILSWSFIMHLAISCSCYLFFLLAKAIMPTQSASWRLTEQRNTARPIH